MNQHDSHKKVVEFVRFITDENNVKINIRLEEGNIKTTKAYISYQFSALNNAKNRALENELEKDFLKSMKWWERSINNYLSAGNKLLKKNTPKMVNFAK